MDYCTKWFLVQLAVAFGPYAVLILAIVFAARWIKRLWLALLITLPFSVLLPYFFAPLMLVLWNGIRPATCN